jgi:PKD repeat protein
MAETWSNSQRTNELFHYHGDPAMKIWTAAPIAITATHPTQITCNAASLAISNASCLDALATVYFNGELLGSTYLVNGAGTINFNAVTNILPQITLTISKDNHIPYVANLPIVNCAFAPSIDFEASTYSAVYCGGATEAITLTDLSYYGPTQWAWSFVPNTVTFVNGTNANSAQPELIFNAAGLYNVQLIASNAFGADSLTYPNYIDIYQGASLPFEEAFEDTKFPPEGWSLTNPDNDISWEQKSGNLANGLSTGSAKMNNYSYNSIGEKDALTTPKIDLSSTVDAKVDFKISHRQFGSYVDSLNVYISTDCGTSYQLIFNIGGSNMVTTTSQGSGAWTPANISDWRTESIDLTAYSGQIVLLKFESVTGYGNNLYLDDINVYSASNLPETDFMASETEVLCQGTSRLIYFTDLSNYSPYGYNWTFSPNTVSYMNATSSNSQHPVVRFDAPGLYQVSLVSSNLNGNSTEVKSDYIQILTGATTPFVEDFENLVGIPVDWTIENPNSNDTWSLENTNTGNGSSTGAAFINYYTYGNIGEIDNLIGPNIDLLNAADAYLSFKLAYQQYGGYVDSLTISVSTDCGASFDTLPVYAKNSVDLETVSGNSNFVPTVASDWRQEIVDLSQYVGNEIILKFEGYCGYGNNLYLDDINVYHSPTTETDKQAVEPLDFDLFPNPTDGLVQIHAKHLANKSYSLELIDAIGQTLLSIDISQTTDWSKTLDLSNYASGMYLVCLKSTDKVQVKKLIID